MTAIKYAAASPHPPIIRPKVDQGRQGDTRPAIDHPEGLTAAPAHLWPSPMKRLS